MNVSTVQRGVSFPPANGMAELFGLGRLFIRTQGILTRERAIRKLRMYQDKSHSYQSIAVAR